MATQTKSKKKAVTKEEILNSFISYTVENNAFPANFFHLAKELGTTERELYNHFSSVEGADEAVWQHCLSQTLETLKNSPEYAGYSGREKALSFYYTWLEHLLDKRSYLLISLKLKKEQMMPGKPIVAEWMKEQKEFWKQLVSESIAAGEIEDRKFLSDKYADAFGLTSMFILNCWKNDNSPKFQKTDQAIEKSINLVFDLMGKSPLDSMLDFGKFMFTQKPF